MPARAQAPRSPTRCARRGRSLNDVAVGHPAPSASPSPFAPSGRAGQRSPARAASVLLRMPPELKERLARRAAERRQNVNELIVGTLSERLGLNGKEPMASTNGTTNGKAPVGRQGPRRDHRRRQLRQLAAPGRRVLQGRDPDDFVPGLMHVDLGGYHIRDIEFVAAFDVVKDKVGNDLADAIWAHPNDTIKFADVPKTGITVSRGMTHDGIGKYLSEVVEKAPGETDDVVGILKETQRRRRRQLPPGRLRGGDQVVRRADPQRRLRDGELHARLHRARAVLAAPLRGGRRADHRRRHQVAGRRDDHAPRADDALPRARRPPRPDDAAERRRQLRLPEHARARPPRVEEDLEDERGHVDARLRHRRRRTSTSARPTTCRG